MESKRKSNKTNQKYHRVAQPIPSALGDVLSSSRTRTLRVPGGLIVPWDTHAPVPLEAWVLVRLLEEAKTGSIVCFVGRKDGVMLGAGQGDVMGGVELHS